MNSKSKAILASVAVMALIVCALAPVIGSSEATNADVPEVTFYEELNFAKNGTGCAAAINEKTGTEICEYKDRVLTFKKSVTLQFEEQAEVEPKVEHFLCFEDGQTSNTYGLVVNEGVTVTIKMLNITKSGTVPKAAIYVGYDKQGVSGEQTLNISGKGTLAFSLDGFSMAILGDHLNIKNTTINVTSTANSETAGISTGTASIDGSKVTVTVHDEALTVSDATPLKVRNTKDIVLKATASTVKSGALYASKTDFPSGQTFRVSNNLDGKDLKNYDNRQGYKYASFGDEIKSDEGFPTWAIILIVVIVVLVIAAAVYYFYFRKKNEGA